jgi:hypothetical protein
MGAHSGRVRRRRVIADEDCRVVGGIDALHHHQGSRPGANDGDVRRELVDEQILTIAVRVADDDLGRTGVARPGNRRKRFAGHELPGARVLESRRRKLIRGHDAGDALHVDRDVDFERPLGRGGSWSSETERKQDDGSAHSRGG